ncbi:MAG: hypothetical protein OXF50_06540 [Caldilineaceae bacterium]|nr:hypothetical protein [Caldilineaceae bacterium]
MSRLPIVSTMLFATLYCPNLVLAQQDSSLTPPALSGHVTANGVELTWTAEEGAVRYDLWVWNGARGWQQLGGNTMIGTSSMHTDAAGGMACWYTVRTVNADREPGPYSSRLSVSVPVWSQ